MIHLLYLLLAVVAACAVSVGVICAAMLIWDGKLTLPGTAERQVKNAKKDLAIKHIEVESKQLDLQLGAIEDQIWEQSNRTRALPPGESPFRTTT